MKRDRCHNHIREEKKLYINFKESLRNKFDKKEFLSSSFYAQ